MGTRDWLVRFGCCAWVGLIGACGARTGLDVPDRCVVLTPETPRVAVEIEGTRRVGALDVVILADTSASAAPYVRGLRRSMTEVVAPALVSISDDARIGVAWYHSHKAV